jgi:hypothetical protein
MEYLCAVFLSYLEMKKFLTIFGLSMLLRDCDYSGTTGTLNWCLKDGTLTISGEGEMPDYGWYGAPWYEYKESIHTVVMENGITTIGWAAFQDCYNLLSSTIPGSITAIGLGAFQDCTNLTSITIPNSVTWIGGWAFQNCTSLTLTTIPNSVTWIGGSAFSYCTNLSSINIPNSVITIENNPFISCTSLTSIDVESENNNYISENGVLFDKSKTTLICYPAGKKETSYVIPNNLKTIGDVQI